MTLSDSSEEFMASIGPRLLRHEEARRLQRLRIREGKDSSVAAAVITILAEEARHTRKHTPDDMEMDGV
jgi:hypothetical protein